MYPFGKANGPLGCICLRSGTSALDRHVLRQKQAETLTREEWTQLPRAAAFQQVTLIMPLPVINASIAANYTTEGFHRKKEIMSTRSWLPAKAL